MELSSQVFVLLSCHWSCRGYYPPPPKIQKTPGLDITQDPGGHRAQRPNESLLGGSLLHITTVP